MAPSTLSLSLRFYAELNDFLPHARRQRSFRTRLPERTAVGQAIRLQGVPPVEVEVVLLNGRSVTFEQRLSHGDRMAVYPLFERFDVTPLLRLRARPLRVPRFLCDVHLGRLARYLRAAGFDTLWREDWRDTDLRLQARADRRTILTRDRELLMHPLVTHGRFVRATAPVEQLADIVASFQLERQGRPFSRCLVCNTPVAETEPGPGSVPEAVARRHRRFQRCPGCDRIYWAGTHHQRLSALLCRSGLQPGQGGNTSTQCRPAEAVSPET